MILVLLQNAYANSRRVAQAMRDDNRLWRHLLSHSRTGKRLKLILGDDCFRRKDVLFANTTPRIGIRAESCLKPCSRHVRHLIERHDPSLIVACGKQAEAISLALWPGPLLCVPHPASRTLTNDLYTSARRTLRQLQHGRLALRQDRDGVRREALAIPA